MTRRHTRPDLERFEAVAYAARKGAGTVTRQIAILVAMGAAIGAGMALPFANDLSWLIFGASIGGFVTLIIVVSATFLILDGLVQQINQAPPEEPDSLLQTGPRTLSRLPESWTRHQARVFLAAVRDEFADFSQRGLAEVFPGKPREHVNDLAEWAVARGHYEFTNGRDNQHGGTWLRDENDLTLLDKLEV